MAGSSIYTDTLTDDFRAPLTFHLLHQVTRVWVPRQWGRVIFAVVLGDGRLWLIEKNPAE